MTAARRVLLVRHGETDHNAGGVWQGQLDTPLSDLGVEQARAADTARVVAQASGVDVTLDPRWREIHVGQWQGLHTSEVRARYADLLAEMDRADIRRGVDGETLAEVGSRAGESLREVLDGLGDDECVVVVAHGVSSRAAIADLLGLDQHLATRALATMGNCHWAELAPSRVGWQLRTWNAGA